MKEVQLDDSEFACMRAIVFFDPGEEFMIAPLILDLGQFMRFIAFI